MSKAKSFPAAPAEPSPRDAWLQALSAFENAILTLPAAVEQLKAAVPEGLSAADARALLLAADRAQRAVDDPVAAVLELEARKRKR